MTTTRQETRFIKDDRGRSVTQLDPFAMQLARRHEVIDQASLRPIADDLGSGLSPGSARAVRVLGTLWALVGVVFVIGIVDAAIHGTWGRLLGGGMVPFFNLWFWPLIVWSVARRNRFGKVKRIMLRHRRCPHCGYDLAGLPVEEDRCTICPECGGAWTLGKPATRSEAR